MSVEERLVAAGQIDYEEVTAQGVAGWMSEALCHPPYMLSQRGAARKIAELWGTRFVSGTGRTVVEPVIRELRAFLGPWLQSDTKRRRWRLTIAGRQKGIHHDHAA